MMRRIDVLTTVLVPMSKLHVQPPILCEINFGVERVKNMGESTNVQQQQLPLSSTCCRTVQCASYHCSPDVSIHLHKVSTYVLQNVRGECAHSAELHLALYNIRCIADSLPRYKPDEHTTLINVITLVLPNCLKTWRHEVCTRPDAHACRGPRRSLRCKLRKRCVALNLSSALTESSAGCGPATRAN